MGWFDQFMTPKLPPDYNGNEGGSTIGGVINPDAPIPPAAAPAPTVAPPAQQAALPPAPPGWDQTKWANAQHTTPKYAVGRILAKYPPTSAGLQQAIPELQQAFPGLTFDGKDTIEFPGIGPVDVLQGASNGGVAWQWIDINADKANAGQGNMGNQGLPPVQPYQGVGGGGGFSGGGDTSGGSSSTNWQMPKGSAYQFGGVPGYSGGYQSQAFSLPGSTKGTGFMDTGGLNTGGQTANGLMDPGSISTSGIPPIGAAANPLTTGGKTADGFMTPGSSNAFGLPADSGLSVQGGKTWNPLDTNVPALSTSGSPGGGMTSSGGVMPSNVSYSKPGSNFMDTGSGNSGGSDGGYDHAPSFTPLDPFNAPPVPDAYKEWKGTAFDVGPGTEKFVLPTGQAALDQDPGYGFRLDQGLKALQGSAAAKGLLRTGGTLKDIQEFGQRAGSQEYQNAVDRAMAVAGFNSGNRFKDLDLGLRANQQNNAFSLQGSQFNADQQQQNYANKFNAANTGYGYANQQNMAGNAQAMQGYQTDVSRHLAQQGINLTAAQNNALNALNGQQQQWMQAYMMNGQSFDQAYKLMMAKLQYPA